MGTWGSDFLDSDDALDIKETWDDFIQDSEWQSEKIEQFFERVYFNNGENHLNEEFNIKILAIAKLFIINKLDISQQFKQKIEFAVSEELRPDRISEWDSPKERRKILNELLKEIDGEKRKRKEYIKDAPKTLDDVAKLKQFVKKSEKWITVVTTPTHDEEFESLYPGKFFKEIANLLRKDIPFVSDNRTDKEWELLELRVILLSFWVGWRINLPKKSFSELVKTAKKSEGGFWPSV